MATNGSSNLRTRREKASIAIAVVAILLGASFFCYGQWATGIGTEGVIHYLFTRFGISLVGVGFLIIGIWFTKRLIADYRGKTPEEKRETAQQAGRQFLTVLLNVIVYGGIFILALGGMSALDKTGIIGIAVVLVVWGLCIGAFVAYRRYRKNHKTGYSVIGNIGVSFAMLAIGLGMFLLGLANSTDALRDLKDGPESADVFLVDAHTDYPNWRYRFITQPTCVLTFYDADEDRIVLEVPDSDVESVKIINDYGNFVHLSYYPHTQVFYSASPWSEGRQVMGNDLLSRLNERYDFDLP